MITAQDYMAVGTYSTVKISDIMIVGFSLSRDVVYIGTGGIEVDRSRPSCTTFSK